MSSYINPRNLGHEMCSKGLYVKFREGFEKTAFARRFIPSSVTTDTPAQVLRVHYSKGRDVLSVSLCFFNGTPAVRVVNNIAASMVNLNSFSLEPDSTPVPDMTMSPIARRYDTLLQPGEDVLWNDEVLTVDRYIRTRDYELFNLVTSTGKIKQFFPEDIKGDKILIVFHGDLPSRYIRDGEIYGLTSDHYLEMVKHLSKRQMGTAVHAVLTGIGKG